MRGLADEFGESTNAIRLELNRFEEAGLLESASSGQKKIYHANTGHPLFSAIQTLLRSHHGIDVIIEKVVKRIGNIEKVCAVGALAEGRDTGLIELILVGKEIDVDYLTILINKVEPLLSRKIEFTVTPAFNDDKGLLLWER